MAHGPASGSCWSDKNKRGWSPPCRLLTASHDVYTIQYNTEYSALWFEIGWRRRRRGEQKQKQKGHCSSQTWNEAYCFSLCFFIVVIFNRQWRERKIERAGGDKKRHFIMIRHSLDRGAADTSRRSQGEREREREQMIRIADLVIDSFLPLLLLLLSFPTVQRSFGHRLSIYNLAF